MNKERNIDTLPLDGGVLCFDFINTVYAWRGENLHEYLGSYGEMIRWCKKVNLLGSTRLAKLAGFARKNPAEGEKAMRRIKELRETLYHIFSSIAANHPGNIADSDLAFFNRELSQSLSHTSLKVKDNKIVQAWKSSAEDLLEPTWLIIRSAYELMVGEDEKRIKECPACGWIFLDKTKNNKRNWCNPQSCGSIDKSRRYYQKKKSRSK